MGVGRGVGGGGERKDEIVLQGRPVRKASRAVSGTVRVNTENGKDDGAKGIGPRRSARLSGTG